MKRIITLLFIVVVVLVASVSIASASSHNPDPVMEVSAPDSVTVGESFTIYVTAENEGGWDGNAGHYSTITISSPSITDKNKFGGVSTSLYSNHQRSAGDEIFTQNGETMSAEYALVEGSTDESQWEVGEEYHLSTEVTPDETGTMIFYIRTTLTDEEDTDIKYTAPDSPDTNDQQNYGVKRVEVEVEPETRNYELTANTDGSGGMINIDPPNTMTDDWSGLFEEGTEIELTADPYSGYVFDGWSGDVSSFEADDETISVTMDEDKTISASFEEEPEPEYTLSVSSDTGGYVDIDSAGSNNDWTESYEEGTEIELTADPDSGYEFDGWNGDVSSFEADDETISVTMDEDKTISASFEEESIEPSISPTFEYSPDQPTEDNDIVFDADGTVIKNGTIDSYQWDFTGDGEYDETGSVVVESFEPGTHTVDLIVNADDGTTETTTEVVEVESAQIDADIQISPSNPREGEDVTIDASDSAVSDGGDEIVEYEWDLNNNEEDKTGPIAVTSFESGTHTIGVTLKTESGLEKHSEKTVEVDPELANIQITATDTTFSVDQSTLIEYSVTNFISSEELTVQMLLEKPDDVAVTDIQNARGTNQFTAVGTVPPGEQETILIEVEPNTAEEIEINAIAEYHISGDEENSERKTESLKFDIEDEQSISDDDTPTSDDDTPTSDDKTDDEAPGFGFSSVILAVIGIGFLIRRSNL